MNGVPALLLPRQDKGLGLRGGNAKRSLGTTWFLFAADLGTVAVYSEGSCRGVCWPRERTFGAVTPLERRDED